DSHRARPSCPTRRSSDLHLAGTPMTRKLLICTALLLATYGAEAQPLEDFVLEVRGDTLVIADFFDAGGTASTLGAVIQADTEAGDRKSTRLNSSHVKISY